MKKILILIFVMLFALGLFRTALAQGKTITLFLDNEKVACDPSPLLLNNRTMIPARALFEEMGAKVGWNETTREVTLEYNDITILLTIDEREAKVNGKSVALDSPAVIVEERTMIPLRFVGEAIGALVSWDEKAYRVDVASPEVKAPTVIIDDLTFSSKSDYDVLSMSASGKVSVKTMRLSNPERMVLDLENANLLSQNAQYEGRFMAQVRYAAHDDYVRIVAENDSLPRYIYIDNGGLINIRFYPEQGNFDYLGTEEKTIILPKGASVSFYKKDGNTLLFTVKGVSMTKETVSINDPLVSTIEASKTTLTVKLTKEAGYSIQGNVIRLKQAETNSPEKENKSGLVVLDAGHGGNDPGSLGYDEERTTILAKEKDMNLAITRKVYDLLKERGVRVALTRSTDVYVGLAERADFANAEDAELFVSIHNNSIPDPDYKGTMVLYSLKSTGGKKLAANILEALVNSAGTIDRGLRDGTNMAVIRRTVMPAVIVECGCLTNQEELANLMDDDFLAKVADGIADGIEKTLKE